MFSIQTLMEEIKAVVAGNITSKNETDKNK